MHGGELRQWLPGASAGHQVLRNLQRLFRQQRACWMPDKREEQRKDRPRQLSEALPFYS